MDTDQSNNCTLFHKKQTTMSDATTGRTECREATRHPSSGQLDDDCGDREQ